MIHNPYWEQLRSRTRTSSWTFSRGRRTIDSLGDATSPDWPSAFLVRNHFTNQYTWTVTDDDTVAFVVEHSGGRIIDPMAGTGYWCHLLSQHGIDCVAFDIDPPQPGKTTNIWHSDVSTWFPVGQADAAQAVDNAGTHRTLLLSWPPDDDTAHRTAQAFTGDRIIYIGEGPETCADEDFFKHLDTHYRPVAYHQGVMWEGMHDAIRVYDRH